MEANIAVLIEGRKFTSVEELDQVFFSNAFWPAPLRFEPSGRGKEQGMTNKTTQGCRPSSCVRYSSSICSGSRCRSA